MISARSLRRRGWTIAPLVGLLFGFAVVHITSDDPAVGAAPQPVKVTNGLRKSVPVQGAFPNHPYTSSDSGPWFGAGDVHAVAGFEVPDQMIVVIEHVSARVRVPPGDNPVCELNYTPPGMATTDHFIVLTYQQTDDGLDFYSASQPIRVYAGGEAEPRLDCHLETDTAPQGGGVTGRISGFAVPAP